MSLIQDLLKALPALVPLLTVLAFTAVLVWSAQRLPGLRFIGLAEGKLPRQVIVVAVLALGVVMAILVLPVKDETKTQLLSLFGLLLTAIIAFSSTTLVTNAMAGLMLRAIRSFHAGDFIRTGEHFGRVTEQGLFHTEIQTGNRDLTSIPNAYLVTHPVTVVRHSGTIVETTLSLGYDVPHAHAEELLVRAARAAELEESFVQILELGNFAITYRVAGFLGETKRLVSAATQLRRAVLDTLHGAGVEIASPSLMGQRPIPVGSRIVPAPERRHRSQPASLAPEELVFDKADEAERRSALRHEHSRLGKEIKALEKARDEAPDARRGPLEAEIAGAQQALARIGAELEASEKATDRS